MNVGQNDWEHWAKKIWYVFASQSMHVTGEWLQMIGYDDFAICTHNLFIEMTSSACEKQRPRCLLICYGWNCTKYMNKSTSCSIRGVWNWLCYSQLAFYICSVKSGNKTAFQEVLAVRITSAFECQSLRSALFSFYFTLHTGMLINWGYIGEIGEFARTIVLRVFQIILRWFGHIC